MRLRRVLIFSRVSRTPVAGAGRLGAAGALGTFAGADAAAGGTGAAGAGVAAVTCSITSGLLTTPPRPVPVTSARLTFWSAATRCAAGDARTSLPAAAIGADGAAGAAGALAGAAAVTTAAAAAPSSTSPRRSPTFTTSPSFTARRVSTPALSAGTSTVILSVSSSTSVSPAATASPSCLSQRDTVASTIDSPRGGTLIAVMSAPSRKKSATTARQLSRSHTVA